MTRVLMALTYYYPHWTGLTANAQNLAIGLVERGHDVTVVTSWHDRNLPREETHRGVDIVRVPSILRLSRGQVMPGFASTVYRLLKEHDLAVVHTPMLETWLVGWLAHRLGKPLIMAHQGDLVMPDGFFNQAVQHVVGYLLDRGASTADLITILNQDYAENSDYLHPHLDKVVPVYPPMTIPGPRQQAVTQWKCDLGLEDRPIVGFAGRWVEEKGFDILLRAIPLVAEQVPEVAFVYAGETNVVYESFYERCEPMIAASNDRLVVLGLITDRQKLADYYAMCDVFVLPSRTDCFAVVQVEAMLCGTPVVASDIPGAREAVRASGMGCLAASADVESLASSIVRVLRNPETYVRPRHEIEGVFDYQKTISAYEGLFEQVLNGRI